MWEVTEESKSDYLEILNHRMVMLCIEIGGLRGGGRGGNRWRLCCLASSWKHPFQKPYQVWRWWDGWPTQGRSGNHERKWSHKRKREQGRHGSQPKRKSWRAPRWGGKLGGGGARGKESQGHKLLSQLRKVKRNSCCGASGSMSLSIARTQIWSPAQHSELKDLALL